MLTTSSRKDILIGNYQNPVFSTRDMHRVLKRYSVSLLTLKTGQVLLGFFFKTALTLSSFCVFGGFFFFLLFFFFIWPLDIILSILLKTQTAMAHDQFIAYQGGLIEYIDIGGDYWIILPVISIYV